MEVAITLGLTKQELIALNLARIFPQFTSLSDIAMSDGVSISWRGKRIPDRRRKIDFARQEESTPYQFGLWQKLLRSFLSHAATSSNHILQQPLGTWTAPSNMTWGAMVYDGNLYRCDPFSNSFRGSLLPVHSRTYATWPIVC